MKPNPDPRRDYRYSEWPVVLDIELKYNGLSEPLAGPSLTDSQRDLLKALYGEICTTWRALMDVRFKLLALVPFVSVGVLVVLLPNTGATESLHGVAARVIVAVGFVVTLGLLIYEVRNSELYNDLISRGRRIEAELGIHTGMFLGRPKAKHWRINHGTAIFLIYAAALAGWGASFFLIP